MNFILKLGNNVLDILDRTRKIDLIGPLALRIYLSPIFIIAGWNKLNALEDTAWYFGEYLGMPAPLLMATLAGLTEFVGGLALLFGFGLRLMVLPLMVTMIVAAATAHWENGWHVLPESTLTVPWEWRTDLIDGAFERREMARSLLKEHGDYAWLTETGGITVLKNGIEFAATYFIMLLILLFTGAGRLISIDYWLSRSFRVPLNAQS